MDTSGDRINAYYFKHGMN